jgi:hypothetical protein
MIVLGVLLGLGVGLGFVAARLLSGYAAERRAAAATYSARQPERSAASSRHVRWRGVLDAGAALIVVGVAVTVLTSTTAAQLATLLLIASGVLLTGAAEVVRHRS